MHRPTTSAAGGVIVAGMGRSGTSLVTNVLGACGWRLGERLLGPNAHAPRGFYEDRALNDLHKAMLREHGLAWNDVEGLRARRGQLLAIPPPLRPEVDELIASYRAGPPWAWKNPRATLFLHAWSELLPEARFLLCVRHPAGVAASLRRRHDPLPDHEPTALRYAARALSLWRSYNLVVERFLDDHPDRASVVLIPDDVATLERSAAGVFGPELLRRPSWKFVAVAELARPCVALHRRLRARHDPAALEALLAGPAARRGRVSASRER